MAKLDTFGLADALDRAGVGNARAVARGALAGLDELAEERAPAGDVGRFGDRAIARAAGCDDIEASILIGALIAAGILVRHATHRLVLAGWSSRAPDAVHAALARERAFFADGAAPSLRPVQGDLRRALAAWYDEQRSTSAPHVECGDQLPLFSSSYSEGSTHRSEEERAPDRSTPSPRRRSGAHAAPRTPAPDPENTFEAIERARAAASLYGATWSEIRAGGRWQLAANVLRAHPSRGRDVLSQCVHGYWMLRWKANEKWDPLDHLWPETVWGPKSARYLAAYDDAIAAGKAPPFGKVQRAKAPDMDVGAARAALESRCDALRDACMRSTGDQLGAERDRRIFFERGLSAIRDRDRKALDQVLAELERDHRATIESAAPMAAGSSP